MEELDSQLWELSGGSFLGTPWLVLGTVRQQRQSFRSGSCSCCHHQLGVRSMRGLWDFLRPPSATDIPVRSLTMPLSFSKAVIGRVLGRALLLKARDPKVTGAISKETGLLSTILNVTGITTRLFLSGSPVMLIVTAWDRASCPFQFQCCEVQHIWLSQLHHRPA